MDAFTGEIRLLPFSFAPEGWLDCNGQTLSIAMYPALAAVIGNIYGGTSTTFNLPNLNGKVPLGFGQGAGLSAYAMGSTGGSASVALTAAQNATHNHTLAAVAADAALQIPTSSSMLAGPMATTKGRVVPRNAYGSAGNAVSMAAASVAPSGGINSAAQAHENRQPFLACRFCIAYEGEFPVRP